MDIVALIFQYLTYVISFLQIQPDWRQAISLKKAISITTKTFIRESSTRRRTLARSHARLVLHRFLRQIFVRAPSQYVHPFSSLYFSFIRILLESTNQFQFDLPVINFEKLDVPPVSCIISETAAQREHHFFSPIQFYAGTTASLSCLNAYFSF